jgi:hypothetical protein
MEISYNLVRNALAFWATSCHSPSLSGKKVSRMTNATRVKIVVADRWFGKVPLKNFCRVARD